VTVLGVFGVNWLDLLLGLLFGGVGVCREIFSLKRTFSGSIGFILVVMKLF
jgi:hypothetical protein